MAPEVMSHKPYNEKVHVGVVLLRVHHWAVAPPCAHRSYPLQAEVYAWAIIVWEMTSRERPYAALAPDFITNYVVDKEYR